MTIMALPVLLVPEYRYSEAEETFCQLYATTRQKAASYRQAYNCDPNSAPHTQEAEATKLLAHPKIAKRVKELLDLAAVQPTMGLAELQQSWVDMADADPNELIGLRIGCCRYCHGAGFQYQWREREYLEALATVERTNRHAKRPIDLEPLPDPAGGFDFNHTRVPHPDCPECRGEGVSRVVPCDTSKLSPQGRLLYGGVKVKKDGSIEMIIADRVKARENAVRMQGGFSDSVRVDGSLKIMAAYVDLSGKDPQAASKVYEQVIRGVALK